MLKSFYLVEETDKFLRSPRFKASYGTILEDIKIGKYSNFYYPIYLMRRIVYPGIIIFMCDYPTCQLITIIAITILPVSSLTYA